MYGVCIDKQGEGKMNIQNMADIMGKLDANSRSSEDAIATYIIQNLIGYRSNSVATRSDTKFIVTAIQAYAKLLRNW